MTIQELINSLLEMGKFGLTKKVYMETDAKRLELTEDMLVENDGKVFIMIEELLQISQSIKGLDNHNRL